MTESDVIVLLREGIWVTLLVGGPLMGAALLVGLAVSLLQALTQVNEASLIFVPKLLAVAAIAGLAAPYVGRVLGDYARLLFDRIVAVGGV